MPDIFLYPGEANPNDIKLRDPTTADSGTPPVTGTAAFDQAPASWDATALETFLATATWDQTASWDATATEQFTSTADFVQAAATWDAAALERLTATATWVQSATWDAIALQVEAVTSSASFEQTADWAASAFTPATETSVGPQLGKAPRFDPPPAARGAASFNQGPAAWLAVVDVNDDAVMLGLTDLVLELV